jgi:putative nucleotidyltransferase with HDIG domain
VRRAIEGEGENGEREGLAGAARACRPSLQPDVSQAFGTGQVGAGPADIPVPGDAPSTGLFMKASATPHLIDVQSLRVGMFVHLDIGWMSHPFPLSSFKISSLQQVATIRSLGLKRVRWNPQQSDVRVAEAAASFALAPDATPSGAEPNGSARVEASAAPPLAAAPAVEPAGGVSAEAADPAHPASPSDASGPASPSNAAWPSEDGVSALSSAEQRRRLAEQRTALLRCERRFGEAARACRQLTEQALSKPQDARVQAEALARSMTDRMAGEEDLCIHLLTQAAGDKVSMHAVNVALIALLMGRVFGFGEEDLQDLGVGALLHDVGKVEMPLLLRHADDSFSPAERRDYEEHVAQGLAVARRMGLSPGATLVIAQHHEHADGSGFPLRLNTDRMTVAARIVALVNRYDNLCNPYFLAKALTPHEALSLLFAQGKSKFDSSILNAFIKMMGVYPPGSTVQLTDDRYALVVSVNSSRPLKPSVLVHQPEVPRDEALVLDLDQAHDLGIRRSIRPVQLPQSVHEYLAPRQRVAYFFEPVRVQEPVA